MPLYDCTGSPWVMVQSDDALERSVRVHHGIVRHDANLMYKIITIPLFLHCSWTVLRVVVAEQTTPWHSACVDTRRPTDSGSGMRMSNTRGERPCVFKTPWPRFNNIDGIDDKTRRYHASDGRNNTFQN